jgi:NAD(P)-dependent dehydrogenase (short-subunit alcohol dehydrogenase family)
MFSRPTAIAALVGVALRRAFGACGASVRAPRPVNPRYDFTGQVALVTGASSGMGLGTAQAFAEAGAAVVLVDINEGALHAATDALTAAGYQALGVRCDVSQEDQVAAMVDRTVAAFGRLDMAFNNAGIQPRPPTPPTSRPRPSTGSMRSTCVASGPA